MKHPASWLSAVLAIACLVLGYLVIHQKTELALVRSQLGSAAEDAQKRIIDLQHQVAAAKAATAKASAAPVAAAAGDRPQAVRTNTGATIIHIGDILKDHPEYLGLYAKQMRRNVERMYGDTLATLNLPADQLAKLKGLLAEKQMSSIDAIQAAEAAGIERGTPEWQDAIKQAAQDTEQQISAIMGPNADNTLAQLQMKVSFQNQVQNNYAADFANAGAPLSPDQSHALVQALSDANYAGKDTTNRPANYNEVDPTTGLTPHDSRIVEAAAQSLSPAQIQVLKTDQMENAQLSALMRQYNKGNGPVMFVP